jgi:hypothetical protein
VLLILRGEDKNSRDAMSISIWNLAADVSNGENDDFILQHDCEIDKLLRFFLADACGGGPVKRIRESISTSSEDRRAN